MMSTCKLRLPMLLVALVAFTLGCRGTKKDQFELPGQTDLLIKQFSIRGVTHVSESELKAGLATQQSSWRGAKSVKWVPLLGADKQYFNHVRWQQDLERIRTFYYARGYFDAKVVSENIVEDPEKREVRISVSISEGEPTKVSMIEVDGIDRLELDRDLREDLVLREGDIFTQGGYLDARKQMGTELERAGYAYAQVEGRVIVDAREREASVVYYVDAGPLAQFGEITIDGMNEVPESAIREALTFAQGGRFSPEKMQETQERIYDLGVFSTVKVVARTDSRAEEANDEAGDEELTDDLTVEVGAEGAEGADEGGEFDLGGLGGLLDQAQEQATARAVLDPVVPVTVQVKEAKLWSVRVGAGVAAEFARQEAHGRLDWTSRNFLGGLRKLEHFNAAGYAWAPSVFRSREERNEGVIVDSELRFTQPRFIERFTLFETRLRFQRQVEEGFNLVSPTAKFSVRRRFFKFLTAELSYNFALFLLSGIDRALLDPSLRLQPEYILEYFEQRVAFDFRNAILNPTRGTLVELQLQEATEYIGRLPGVPTGGHFDYLAPTVSVEQYVPMWSHVLALRARAATIYNLGDKRPPIPQRLYAGGADSMRAFGRQRLALYSVSGEALPIGGFSKFEASVEPRFRIIRALLDVGDLWVAPFLDAATVLPGSLFVATDPDGTSAETWTSVAESLLYGVGLGTWWVTPVGPVRLDVAYRLSGISEDPRFRRCAVEPNVAGTCNGGFIVGEADPVRELVKSRFNIILGIGHSF